MPLITCTDSWTTPFIQVPGDRPVRRPMFGQPIMVSEPTADFLIEKGLALVCDEKGLPKSENSSDENKPPEDPPPQIPIEVAPSENDLVEELEESPDSADPDAQESTSSTSSKRGRSLRKN